GGPLVPLRVVLHRTAAERIEVSVDRHVERRQVEIVANDLRFRHFRKRGRRGGDGARRQQILNRRFGHIARRQASGATAWLGEIEQELRVAGISHRLFLLLFLNRQGRQGSPRKNFGTADERGWTQIRN